MATARAISVRRRSPPESWMPKLLRTFCRRNSSMSDSRRSRWYSFEKSVISSTERMLSSTDRRRKTEASCAR